MVASSKTTGSEKEKLPDGNVVWDWGVAAKGVEKQSTNKKGTANSLRYFFSLLS